MTETLFARVKERALASARNIGPTFAANIFNQAVVMFTQLVMTPLLIGALGLKGFGVWIVLAAIPAYLSISDFGFSYSAKSDMAVRVSAGDIKGAVETISSVAFLMLLILSGFSAVYFIGVFAVDWTAHLDLNSLSLGDARLILLLGLIQINGYQGQMISSAILRAAKKPAMESFCAGAFRLAETTALVIGAYLSHNLVVAAACWALTRLVSTVLVTAWVWITIPYLRMSRRAIRFERMKALLRPSMAFMMMPLANSLLLQGSTLVVSGSQGAIMVAAFTITRTITRMGVSIGNTLNFTFVPQYSYAYGSNNVGRIRELLRLHSSLLAAGAVGFVLMLVVAGPFFTRLLSHHQAHWDAELFYLMLVAALFEMAWSLPLTLGTANNRVGTLTVAYVALSVIYIVVTWFSVKWLGTYGVASGLAAVNLVMVVVAWLWLQPQLALARNAPGTDKAAA